MMKTKKYKNYASGGPVDPLLGFIPKEPITQGPRPYRLNTSGTKYVPVVTDNIPRQYGKAERGELQKELETYGTNRERRKGMGNPQTEVIRKRLDNNFFPVGYGDGAKRFKEAVIDNKKNYMKGRYDINASTSDVAKTQRNRLDAWSTYLGQPQKWSTFKVSEQLPTKGNSNQTYYDFAKLNDEEKESFVRSYKERENTNIASDWINDVMGDYTITSGKDEKGDYVSYYDKWDLAGEPGVGKPFEIYGRVYYDPKTGKPVDMKKTKKYATGGGLPGMDMIAPALMNLIPQAINIGQAATSKPIYDPQADGKFDVGQVASSALASGGLGPLGIIAGGLNTIGQLVKSNKAKHTTVYGSPGQYASGGDLLKRGSRNEEVARIQTQLKALGLYTGPIDSIYGPKTSAAVKAYQASNGLSVDGIVGEKTRGSLSQLSARQQPVYQPTVSNDYPRRKTAVGKGELRSQMEKTGTNSERTQNQLLPDFLNARLDNNFLPVGYESDSYTDPVSRFLAATAFNSKDPQIRKGKYLDDNGEVVDTYRDRADAWSLYLGQKQKFNKFKISDYEPTKSSDPNQMYYDFNSMPEHVKMKMVEDYTKNMKPGTNEVRYDNPQGIGPSDSGMNTMGNYTLSGGKDDKGNYVSYYDKWDLAGSTGVGKPFDIYGRIYYDPKTNLPTNNTYDNPNGTENKISKNMTSTKRGFASGGDMSLNNQSFQVDAPANQTDVKHYPEFNVNLDNNEVVDAARKIVYSNKIKNPATGNTFAEDAAKIERAKGKAQKKVERYKDKISEDTISALDKQSKDLYSKQEVIATLMGKRDENGATIQGRAMGGPIDPLPNQPFMSIGGDYYYDPYGRRYVSRNPLTGSYSAVAGTPGFSTGQGFRPYAGVQGDNLITYPTTTQDKGLPNQSISNHLRQYPSASFDVTGGRQGDNLTPTLFGATPDATRDGRTLPEVTINGNRPSATNPKAPLSRRGQAKPAVTAVDPTIPFINPLGNSLSGPASNAAMYESMKMKPMDPLSMTTGDRYSQQTQFLDPSKRPIDYSTEQIAKDRGISNGQLSPSGLSKFTTGDYVQMAAAAASFAPLLEGPQRETPYLDNTQISKQAYDVNPQLYQSGRSYRNAVNSIDTQSPNLRRAIQNSLYAQKLNTDNQVVQQYQGMNNQAQQQYETRLADQRRYNIGQTTYTNELNRRNEGAYNTSLDNAFRTVSNFGQGLNQKQQGQDVMNLFRTQYSDVYDRIIKALTEKQNGN